MRIFAETEPLVRWPSGISAYVVGLLHGFAEIGDPSVALETGCASARPARHAALRQRLRQMDLHLPYHCVPLPGRLAARLGALRRYTAWPPFPAFDIAHSTAILLSHTAPARRRLLTVYDVGFLRYPKRRFGGDIGEAIVQRFARDLRRADRILAISEFTKRELLAVCGVPPECVTVTPLAVQWQFEDADNVADPDGAVLAKHGLAAGAYFLSVGLLSPRKNYDTVLKAFSAFRARQPAAALVIVGDIGWDTGPLEQQIKALGPAVRWIRRAGQHELAALYRQATALVYLSWYEGFGIPVLEAMTWGCPAIVARGSALDEVLGKAGLTVEPPDAAAAVRCMESLWDHPEARAEWAERGRQRARAFTWRRTAEATLAAYRTVLDLTL
jgi:glycosyltransferase involved in cell wall biosynthesis